MKFLKKVFEIKNVTSINWYKSKDKCELKL